MTAVWIRRNDAGIIRAVYVAAYTSPQALTEMADGGTLELVDAPNGITVNAPLPSDCRVVDRFPHD